MRQVAQSNMIEIANPHRRATGSSWTCALAGILGVLLSGPSFLSVAVAGDAIDERVACEFRVVWGGPTARTYEAQASVDNGGLRWHRNLSLQSDSIGSIRSSSPTSLEIQPHSPATFGGVDIDVQGTLETRLKFAFKNPATQQLVEHSIPLGEILQGTWIEALDGQGTKIAVERQIHDRIQIHTHRAHEVLNTNEVMDIEVLGNRTGLAAGEYSLQVELAQDHGQTRRLQEIPVLLDGQGNFESVDLSVTAPDQEGVYRLEVKLVRKRFLQSLMTSSAGLSRQYEFVVFDAVKSRQIVDDWKPLALVDVLHASKPGALAWLSPLSNTPSLGISDRWQRFNPLKGTLNQPLSHGELGSRVMASEDGSTNCLTLEPHAWLAIPLGTLKPDRLHRLKIRIPLDQPFQLAVGIKQTNSRGEFQPIGIDSLIAANPRECIAHGPPAVQMIDFWPSAQNNFVILANTDDRRIASVLDIQIDEAQLASVPARSTDAAPPQPSIVPQAASERLVGVYLDKPLLADSFGSERVVDSTTGRSIESWSTWQTACERLDQSLAWSQANLLILKIQADGGAIFPSRLLSPTARYDSGIFFTDGRSPDIKDGVELLLRHCDRSGVRVVLAMDLDSPLPSLVGNQAANGNIYQQKLQPGDESQHPPEQLRYDPLNSKVQSEILLAVREVATRYSQHESFAGIAFQVDQDSQFVFAGDKWGYGAATLSAFEKDSRAKLPPAEQLPQAFASSLRLAFMNWRAEELTKFFESLGEVVAQAKPEAKFYLNATRLWDHAPSEADFYQPISIIKNPSEYLLAYGIDANRLRLSPKVVLMQGKFQRPLQSMDAGTWIRQVAQVRGLSHTSINTTAAIVIQQPSQYRLREFSKFSTAVGAQAPDLLYPMDAGHQQAERKHLVDQVFTADTALIASGAWLPLTSESSALRELRQTLKAFPASVLDDFALHDKGTNIKVRTGRVDSKYYLQIVNNAPWTEDVAIAAQHSTQRGELNWLAGRAMGFEHVDPNTANASNTSTWQLRIPAYDVIGIESSDPEFLLLDVVHAPSPQVMKEVTDELDQMEAIIVQAADPTQQVPLANLRGDFEQWSTEGWPAGWNVSSLPNVSIRAATELPHSGKKSLLIENGNDGLISAWIQSQPIKPPATKRLAFQAWLRSPTLDRGAVVRLSVVGRTRSGERFESSQQFRSMDAQQQIANDWGTKPATLYVSDIPTEELDELFVAVELIGRGKIWVDDVRVLQSWLQPNERIHLQGMMIVARQQLAEKNPFPAEQMLDSHWGRYLSQFQTLPSDLSAKRQSAGGSATKNSTPVQTRWNESPTLFHEMRDAMRERWRR